MFYKNQIKGKKSINKDLTFDAFQDFVNFSKSQSKQQLNKASNSYNFNLSSGELQTGYGFKKLHMPTNTIDVDTEEVLALDGTKITAVWSFKWYDYSSKQNKYYIVYYNDNNNIGFSNLFNTRPFALFAKTTFTETPVGCNTRYANDDAMVFSSSVDGLFLMTGSITEMYNDAPNLISICSHYDKLFAITAGDRARLVYSDNKDITQWDNDNMQEIIFDDDRGKLNKVIAFNDYVYVFRDFGISKISAYSTRNEFDISQLYQCDSYIYPGTIASSGDKIYFLEGAGIFSFNGSSTSRIDLDCSDMLKKADKRNASAVCFESKYYLACRYDFNDGQTIGCETEEGYINNVLFVFDLVSKKVDLLRGIDIKQLCVLNNPYKSKVVACFNGQNIGNIGELTCDGKIFDSSTEKSWTSVKSDFGYPDKLKKIKHLTIKTLTDCELIVESDKQRKTFMIEGSEKIQQIRVDVTGKEMQIGFKTSLPQANISNVKIVYNVI